MKKQSRTILVVGFILITGLYFTINGLIEAQAFLAPVVVASLLAMMFVPMTQKLEHSGFGRGWAALVAVLVALVFAVGLFFLVSIQVKRIVEDWPQIKERLLPQLEQLQEWIADKSGIDPNEQENMIKEQLPGDQQGEGNGSQDQAAGESSKESSPDNQGSDSGGSGSPLSSVGSVVMSFFSFLGTALLTCVYIFFMLLYRSKLRKSLLRFFSDDQKPQAKEVLHNSIKISQAYLIGRFWLITILAIAYSIGLSITGVQHAILISILAAMLSLVPYVGNIVAFVLALAMGAFSGIEVMGYLGIVATFSITQFIESYILEPYIVGHKVELNPLITILVVVLGGAVWGVVGMIISIPLFGIIKIMCDNIPVLQPVGYLLGEEGLHTQDQDNFMKRYAQKIRDRFTKK